MINSAIKKHLSSDPALMEVIQKTVIEEIKVNNDVFGALTRAIVFQQLSTKAASTIYNRFLALFETDDFLPPHVLALSPEHFQSVGLSRQKAMYVHNVASYFYDKNPTLGWESLSDEQIVEELTQIKGIGKWTVQMILIFHLGRPDVFPTEDLGIQQSMIDLYGIKGERKQLRSMMSDVAENWRPYRSYACRYLWRWKDNGMM